LRYAAEVYEKGYGTRLLPAFFLEELFDEGLGLALELAGFAEDLVFGGFEDAIQATKNS